MDVFEYGNPNASLILLQMIGDHDIEMIDHEFDLIQKAVSDELCLIACKVDDWNRDLSPWKAPAVFKSESFGENAAKTLSEVLTYIGERNSPASLADIRLQGCLLCGQQQRLTVSEEWQQRLHPSGFRGLPSI